MILDFKQKHTASQRFLRIAKGKNKIISVKYVGFFKIATC